MNRVFGCVTSASPAVLPGSGEKAHHVARHARFVQNINEDRGNRRRIARWLYHHRISSDDRSHRHPTHDRRREIPWRNHDAHAQRNIFQIIFLAAERRQFLRRAQPQCFPPVVFAEINQFGDVRIRFRPGLANFIAQPRIKFVAPLAQNIRRAIQAGHALFHWHALPAFKCRSGFFDGLVRHLHRRLLKHANHLLRVRWIVRLDLFRGGDALSTNGQRIFAPKHSAHLRQTPPPSPCGFQACVKSMNASFTNSPRCKFTMVLGVPVVTVDVIKLCLTQSVVRASNLLFYSRAMITTQGTLSPLPAFAFAFVCRPF